MKLKDMNISTQLRVGMGAIMVFVAILGATAWFQADDLWQKTKDILMKNIEDPLQELTSLTKQFGQGIDQGCNCFWVCE